MSERRFIINNQCTLDEHFKLYYPNGIFEPCQIIQDPKVKIGIIDNNNINPSRLMLKGADYHQIVVHIPKTGEIVKVTQPGKTGIIYLENQIDISRFKKQGLFHLGGGIDRRDHLHIANVGEINRLGWKVYWAPLQMTGHLMHARMVPPNREVTEKDAQELAKIFKKYI